MRIVKAAEEFAASSQSRPFARRIVRAVGAGIRELVAPEPVVRYVTDSTARRFGLCKRCDGTGRKPRLGTRILARRGRS